MNKMQQYIVGAALEYLMSQESKDHTVSNKIFDVIACFDEDLAWGEPEHMDMIDKSVKELHRELYRKIVWR